MNNLKSFLQIPKFGGQRASQICEIVEQSDHLCGDDLVHNATISNILIQRILSIMAAASLSEELKSNVSTVRVL